MASKVVDLTRTELLSKAKRVVVKVGSAVLTDEYGVCVEIVKQIASQLSFLHDTGLEVILVTSGAVAAGRKKISYKLTDTPSLKEKQALAAIGQSCLMESYDRAFSSYNKSIAQVLLTHSDFSDRDRYLNLRNTLLTLFKFDTIPVINENDTVSVEELRFGDNDNLAALLTNLMEADLLVCLTDVNGLYDSNPAIEKGAKILRNVAEITPEIEGMVNNVKSRLGTGGMLSKIKAADIVSKGGGCSFIGPGREKDVIKKLFNDEEVGTFFMPCKKVIHKRKHWIAHVVKTKGELTIDIGAKAAIKNNGKSLLPSGITDVRGEFAVGDSVLLVDSNGDKTCVGLVNYCSEDIKKIAGFRSSEIINLLGFHDSDEVIHRDNLVITSEY